MRMRVKSIFRRIPPGVRYLVRILAVSVLFITLLALFSHSMGGEDEIAQGAAANARRVRRMEKVCEMQGLAEGTSKLMSKLREPEGLILPIQFVVDDVFNVLYCQIPKAGSTNVKRTFLLAHALKNDTEAAKKDVIDLQDMSPDQTWKNTKVEFSRLTEKTDEEAARILSNYTRMIIARHPFERLLSFYKMLFVASGYEDFSMKVNTVNLYRQICERYGWEPPPKNIKMITEPIKLPFPTFVQYVIDHDIRTRRGEWQINHNLDAHWLPMWRQCWPCTAHFDVIGQAETMDRDIAFITRKLGVKQRIVYPDDLKRRTASEVPIWFSQNITCNQLEALNELYSLDFDLFGYAPFDIKSVNCIWEDPAAIRKRAASIPIQNPAGAPAAPAAGAAPNPPAA
ncbi:carbohydrate sulfotransferase 11 [Lingula anatina]|uniref:Carbohydrate sulfotransferase n=1 Tax=Lingula anatina TaxID=7574 RepID=A0A1S3I4U6_LINAN|nr:carbohydrate sulfotransferase 11 [Lingula anatina]|eukprot:XP_013392389.1 carbohydrate sulfotransferase 11 [Lingula anatina]